MSTSRPRVSTRGWALDSLIKSSTNFCGVERVSASSDALLDVVRKHEREGVPLVIQGFHKLEKWPSKLFTLEGFSGHSDTQEICVRNMHSRTDKTMDMGEFIVRSRNLSRYAGDGECERFYGKDAQCPDVWEECLCKSGILPPYVLSCGPEDEFRFRPESSRVETLMCYLGVGDTYTPSHKDLCASSGQNLMCYTENDGSSFWFMTESSAAPEASSYFHELGQELDHEDYVVTLDDFSKAPFKVYALEQKLGDLVLVPPRSCHQVVNYGGITVKTSWSRITLQGLSTAYYHELPIYRRVCRPETYRIKSTIHYALVGRTKELANWLLHENEGQPNRFSFPENLAKAINSTCNAQAKPSHIIERHTHSLLVAQTKQLVRIYDSILAEERPKAGNVVGRKRSLLGSFNDDNRIVCDFCECDIFQSFFECLRCKHSDRMSGHIVCPGCYAEGRSCSCIVMQPMQCRDFEVLDKTRSEAARVLESFDVWVDEHPATNLSIPKLFQAACVVLEMWKDTKRPMKSCTKARGRDHHEVPSAWGLHCRHCHLSTCFECILKKFKMHSTEALQLFDDSRERYHEKHTLSGTQYKSSSDKLQHAQRLGTPVEGHLLLVHVTLKYTSCTPLNLKGMELGWYDAKGNSGASPSKFAEHNMGMHKGTQLTIKIPPINQLSQSAQLHSIMERRRVYVEIPPAPYSTHKKARRTSKNDPHPLTEINRHSVYLTPRLPPRLQALEMSHKSLTPNEDIRSGDNVANIKASSTNNLLTRNRVSTKSVRPANRPSMISPLKYKENQDAKRATLARLSFKKICLPSPNEGGSVILTPDFTPGNSLGSLTSPSDHDPTTPPSSGPSSQHLPSRDEPSITQLLAQIAGTTYLSSHPDDRHVSEGDLLQRPNDLYQQIGETGP